MGVTLVRSKSSDNVNRPIMRLDEGVSDGECNLLQAGRQIAAVTFSSQTSKGLVAPGVSSAFLNFPVNGPGQTDPLLLRLLGRAVITNVFTHSWEQLAILNN